MFDSSQVRPFDSPEDSKNNSNVEAHTPTRSKSAQSNASSPSSVTGVNLFDSNQYNVTPVAASSNMTLQKHNALTNSPRENVL